MLFGRFADNDYWKLVRPDAVYVWNNEEVRRRLSWYYKVMNDEAPAKFMLAKIVEAEDNPQKLNLEALIDIKNKLSREHNMLWNRARKGEITLEDYLRDFRSKPEYSLLHIDSELAKRYSSPCRLCERRCRVDRINKLGACRIDLKTYVHSWFHHLGEEPPLVPSGTIFYGGCNFTCVYCQNYDISQTAPRFGDIVDARKLADIQRILRIKGARNINHVGGDPTPNIHTIVESLLYLEVNTPQLWNSNMYVSLEAMDILVDIIDIWLPDFKYGSNSCATRLSAAPRYVDVVLRNLQLAASNGDMIIRHLVLPNHIDCCSIRVMDYIASKLPVNKLLVNIMEQYRPEHLVVKYPNRWRDISRRPKMEELGRVYDYAKKLGILFEPVS